MNAWANIKTITKRELGAYFSSPLAYIFIVIFLLLCGFFTFMVGGFFERGEASLVRPFFDWHPWFYLFLVPAVGMRLWAEERRVGTLELLLTMPITAWQAIVGKFLASWLFLALALGSRPTTKIHNQVLAHGVERHNAIGVTLDDCRARHSRNHASLFTLRDGNSAGRLDCAETFRAVFAHAGH